MPTCRIYLLPCIKQQLRHKGFDVIIKCINAIADGDNVFISLMINELHVKCFLLTSLEMTDHCKSSNGPECQKNRYFSAPVKKCKLIIAIIVA